MAWKTRSHSSPSSGCSAISSPGRGGTGLRQRLGHHHDGLGVDDVAALAQQALERRRRERRQPEARPQPAAAVLVLGARDQAVEVAAAAVDARRVGSPREAVA